MMTLNIRGNRTLSFFDSTITVIITPFQYIINNTVNTVSGIWNNYFYLVDLKQKNELLNKQIKDLKQKNYQYIEQDLQYLRLLKLLNFKKNTEKEAVLAEVIGIDSSNWSRMVFINKGENKKIGKNMAIVTHEGLVGRVVQSTNIASKVLLVTDIRSAVDVLIQKNRYRGMVVGLNKDFCNIKYVPNTAEVKVGDRVVSSGLGEVFPKGIMVGFVKKVKKEKYGLFQHIELTPSANLSKLEEVLVISK